MICVIEILIVFVLEHSIPCLPSEKKKKKWANYEDI